MAQKYEYYDTPSDDLYIEVFSPRWEAQPFIPSVAHKVTSVKLNVRRLGLPGTITVSIKATDGDGHPTGADLCSGTTDGNTLPSASWEWREITLGDGYDLAADTKYAIVVRGGTAWNKCVMWHYGNIEYPAGCALHNDSEGAESAWEEWTATYALFEEWGEAPGPTIQTQDATGIKSDEAMLHTKVLDDKGKTLSVRHNWGKTTAYGENTPWQEGKHTDDLISQKITDLDPETEYHFRGEAIFED